MPKETLRGKAVDLQCDEETVGSMLFMSPEVTVTGNMECKKEGAQRYRFLQSRSRTVCNLVRVMKETSSYSHSTLPSSTPSVRWQIPMLSWMIITFHCRGAFTAPSGFLRQPSGGP